MSFSPGLPVLRASLASLLLGLILPLSLPAQTPAAGPEREGLSVRGLPADSSFSPARFFPGDRVEFLIPMGGSKEFDRPQGGEDLEIVSAELAGQTLRVILRPWRPGTLGLPAFNAGGRTVGPVSLRVESALAAFGSEPRGQRSPLLLPGSRGAVVLLFSLAAAAILVSWAGVAFLWPRISRFLRWRRGKRPYARFLRDAAILAKRSRDDDPRYFYALLSRSFRVWAASRIHPAFASLTAREVGEAGAADGAGELFALASKASGPLGRSELVRFAGESSDVAQRMADLDLLSSVVRDGEAAYERV